MSSNGTTSGSGANASASSSSIVARTLPSHCCSRLSQFWK